MTESSSTTKRLKTSDDDDPESSASSSKTVVSLNKITLVPMISPVSSPNKQTSVGVGGKMSFIDSLTKKVNISPTQTNPATTTTGGCTSGASKRILTITSSNGTSISPSAFASSLNGNENKIQYVKIVNSSSMSTKDASSTVNSTSAAGVKLTSVCSAGSASSSVSSTSSATQVSVYFLT